MGIGRLGIHGRSQRRGITIVEIVVVLACLAILAAMLFPLLVYVRETADRTKCASNMRQLAQAFLSYAQDWTGRWPSPGGLMGDHGYWAQSGPGGLNPYVRQRGYGSAWCCPRMPEWNARYEPRSYSMNSYLREPADCEYPGCTGIMGGIRVSSIEQLDYTVLLFEGLPLIPTWQDVPAGAKPDPFYVYIYRCCNWTGVKGYYPKLAYTIDPAKPWHRRVNNYIMTDGHLVTRPPGRKTIGELSTYKEMYQWYVDKDRFQNKVWPKWKALGAPYE